MVKQSRKFSKFLFFNKPTELLRTCLLPYLVFN